MYGSSVGTAKRAQADGSAAQAPRSRGSEPVAAECSHFRPPIAPRKHPVDLAQHRLRRSMWRHYRAAFVMPHDLARAAYIAHDGGQAGGDRLDHRQAERLEVAERDEDIGRLKILRDIFHGAAAPSHRVRVSRDGLPHLGLAALVRVSARADKQQIDVPAITQALPQLHELEEAFRPADPSGVDEDRAIRREPERDAQRRLLRGRRRREVPGIHSVRNLRDLRGLRTELDQPALERIGEGDEAMRQIEYQTAACADHGARQALTSRSDPCGAFGREIVVEIPGRIDSYEARLAQDACEDGDRQSELFETGDDQHVIFAARLHQLPESARDVANVRPERRPS